MCFCRLGDLDKVTLKQIVALRKCPNLTYAVAYWLNNNFGVSEVRNDGPSLSTFWRERRDVVQYLGLIIRTPDEQWNLKNAIFEMEKDDFCDICKGSTKDAKCSTVCDTCEEKHGISEDEESEDEAIPCIECGAAADVACDESACPFRIRNRELAKK